MIPEYISRNTREKMLAFHLLHTVRAWKSDGRGSHASILSVRSSGNALQILASMAAFSDPSPQATSASRSKPRSSDLVLVSLPCLDFFFGLSFLIPTAGSSLDCCRCPSLCFQFSRMMSPFSRTLGGCSSSHKRLQDMLFVDLHVSTKKIFFFVRILPAPHKLSVQLHLKSLGNTISICKWLKSSKQSRVQVMSTHAMVKLRIVAK